MLRPDAASRRIKRVAAEALDDLTPWLRRIDELDLGRLITGNGNGARHGKGVTPTYADVRPSAPEKPRP